MKFVACVFAAAVVAAAAAPALSQGELPLEDGADQNQQQQQFLREKRSSYPSHYYAPAPCASSHHVPTYIAPVHHAAYAPLAPHYGYGLSGLPALPHYRDAEDHEMMSFSDMDHVPGMSEQFMAESLMQEHIPLARYAYGAPAVAAHYGGAAAGLGPASGAVAGYAAGAPGTAIGVFPNANTGGCSVPLLLSCSPSIRPGRIVKSQHGYGGDSYRGVDEAHATHETHEDSHNQLTAHDATSEHMPLHQ